MKYPNIDEALNKYTRGEATLEETNKALIEAGWAPLNPTQNIITEEELAMTSVGYSAAEANGYGLLGTGTGSMEKVHVVNGRLDYPVNEIQADGSVNMDAEVHIGGQKYAVRGDMLVD